jgi:hypothetical protein
MSDNIQVKRVLGLYLPKSTARIGDCGFHVDISRMSLRFRVVPVNAEIARAEGLYKSKFGKSHGFGLADAILAAARPRMQI